VSKSVEAEKPPARRVVPIAAHPDISDTGRGPVAVGVLGAHIRTHLAHRYRSIRRDCSERGEATRIKDQPSVVPVVHYQQISMDIADDRAEELRARHERFKAA